MKKAKEFFNKSIGRWFRNASDSRVGDLICIENMRSLYRFSIIVILIEMISILSFFLLHWNTPNFWKTLFNVVCCVIVCAVVAVLAKGIMIQYRKNGKISSRLSNSVVTFFYLLLSVWGAFVDLAHYKNGEQMLTFYIVQFCFLCFVVMMPKLGGILVILSFSFFYFLLYQVDGAAGIQPQNYIIFLLIAIWGNAIQYTILQEAEKNKVEILELNKILQEEAIIDDLTKLKNRNGLNRDMEKYIGQSVYVIMADIDYFKKYNDTYGHLVGDQVLNLVAASAKKTFFGGEAYRYGGDEFLIVLPNCTKEDYEERMREWKKAIRAIQINPVTIPIECSNGSGSGCPKNTDEFKDIIKKADDRLYDAKKARV